MNPLHLLSLRIHPPGLMRFAHARGLLDRQDAGMGYALHAWLVAMFGEHAPRPYRYFDARTELLGYGRAEAQILREHAQAFAPADAYAALVPHTLVSKPMPNTWREGQRLSFETQTTPIVRTAQGVEKDALLHALDQLGAQAPERGTQALHALRETTYQDWLHRQCGEALAFDTLLITGLLRQRLMRRRHDAERRRHILERPIVTFSGQARIRSPQAFADLLARGIGRHRAFGLGMILLAPPR